MPLFAFTTLVSDNWRSDLEAQSPKRGQHGQNALRREAEVQESSGNRTACLVGRSLGCHPADEQVVYESTNKRKPTQTEPITVILHPPRPGIYVTYTPSYYQIGALIDDRSGGPAAL